MPIKATVKGTLVWVTAAVLACGGGGGPTGVPATNVVGHYSITHTGTLVGFEAVSCLGVLDITSQTGNSFSGTITITATGDCQALAGQGTINGTVASSGAVTFTVSISSLDELLQAAQCDIVSGSPTFTGTATTTGISATRTNFIHCDIEGGGVIEGDFVYTISGPKT
jgi:hypothetical protein